MSYEGYTTPLLSPDSPLDEHARAVISELYEAEQQKALTLPTDDPLDPKRRERVEHTVREMWEQPEVLQKNIDLGKKGVAEAAAHVARKPIDRIYLTGCGDSVASMIAVRGIYEELLGIQCEAIQALDFAYYYDLPVDERTLVITLSSSGKTTRTVEAMMVARARGATTLTLSNTEGSPLMRESTRGLLIHAERKGWPTQSSTAAMVLLYMLGAELARNRGVSDAKVEECMNAIGRVPGQVQHVLEQNDSGVLEVAKDEAERAIYLFCGGGPAFASALIGAAKVRECSPDHSIAIPLEEYHHYNSQKAGDPLFLIAPRGATLPRALDTVREGRRWGGQVYSVVTEGDRTLDEDSTRVFRLPTTEEWLSPIVYTVPVQIFACHVAREKFRLAEAASG